MRSSIIAAFVGAVLCWAAGPVRAGGIVVDQQPCQVCGGPASDTAFYYPFPPYESWQLEADNIVLEEEATIRRVSWWGFYGSSKQDDEPPVGDETMRVRFYAARPGDGLPDEDNIIYEESYLNPSRTATGEVIWVDDLPAEYVYEVDLTTPFQLQAETLYWFETVQVGDIESTFRWESGFADIFGHAFLNDGVPDWQFVSGSFALQLSTIPEPRALSLCLCVVILVNHTIGGGRRRGWM